MAGRSLRGVLQLVVGVVIAAVMLHTWLVMGWIVPVTVSGSSMAPTLLGPHRMYLCRGCRHKFAVGLDQLPPSDAAMCPSCGRRRAAPIERMDRRGERLAIDRTAFAWREPRRWEVVVFRYLERGGELCVKRVVALPGETLSIAEGDVLVNGQIVRKSLAEQRAVRQLVYASNGDSDPPSVRVGELLISVSPRWRIAEQPSTAQQEPRPPVTVEYHRLGSRSITDEIGYNQGAAPAVNQVTDIMLTFVARLAGDGRLVLAADIGTSACELTVDFAQRRVALRRDGRVLADRPLPNVATDRQLAEWTLSLFDRQALLAIGDEVVLAEPWGADQVSSGAAADSASPRPPFSIGLDGLSGEIRKLAVWRDVYYAVRHGDGRQPDATRSATTTWRLGPNEFFVVGDNAAISDDSRSWLSAPGVDAKLLIGKPLGVR